MTHKPIHIIGGGMAGTEAAWQAANMGVPVILHEMRPHTKTPAHQTEGLGELVCSNSFRSDDKDYNAVGLLHEEMRMLNSLMMQTAAKHSVPAGGALAVDRDAYSNDITKTMEDHSLITIQRGEISGLPPQDWDSVIIATGPLTSPALSSAIKDITDEDSLAFFDAIAPIVYFDSINMDVAWLQSRYDKEGPAGTGKDYINCGMNKDQYLKFYDALTNAETTEFKDWEKDTPYFEGCMPIEVMASRGIDTLRYGPMKPVGLTNQHDMSRPYAVVQLRQDNALGTLYNIVGFQTKMKYAAQTEVFKLIPGLENAEFARLGGIHRNTFINSPRVLNNRLQLKNQPRFRFAGQITGCEGYVESAAVGLIAGRLAASERLGKEMPMPPNTTALGAILAHITGGANEKTFQPMNVNFGLFPDIETSKKIKGRDRKKLYSARALIDLTNWIKMI
ncbi:MAG TPA: methylenetetrahydrofolate--tRNA-(uracil(54)-C(5))-methyltransferase (FADH(2)-oxidizing) TrmFO [Alphaproteobacteria bacterium]|nr:methylenetetrahydrofolate--tRNA-(uracil(54)-C(5))-methyltransferase (FADH(2)-oxidizing) TrmFO [Alphaproteobacteria bacterium]MCB9985057.1 methylenetetrahydrofolate--tRNA-(uracil(54)-C(5))-methyltransferase (FADH(2)-oxidizing) TrmFO [Micavibrio sp.]HRK97439.1 methylenetetrahydrofolate--tRNA-(uracil(54)-C(5))-methyltransferase (FADH(2)-oxidizing) TrmFO [Alphaproteobacteria bacterium]